LITLLILGISFVVKGYLFLEVRQAMSYIEQLETQNKSAKIATLQVKQGQKMLSISPLSNVEYIEIKTANEDHNIDYKAFLFWNRKKHSIYLDTSLLPKLEDGKSYQLWAFPNPKIKNAKPINAANISGQKNDGELFISLKHAQNIQGFALTIVEGEKVVEPSIENIVAIGMLAMS